MIRVTRKLIRFLGWLLTPLVVWAAAFLGGWIGALIGARIESPTRALVFMIAGALVGSVTSTILWAWALRRSARVQAWGRRQLRHITRKGLPRAKLEPSEVDDSAEADDVSSAQSPDRDTVGDRSEP